MEGDAGLLLRHCLHGHAHVACADARACVCACVQDARGELGGLASRFVAHACTHLRGALQARVEDVSADIAAQTDREPTAPHRNAPHRTAQHHTHTWLLRVLHPTEAA